jgi:hypothetical protein
MKYAYVHKNLRQLNLERMVIFGCHVLTMIACFLPWFAATPAYERIFYYSSFRGPGFLIGICIFLISLSVVILFLDKILERNVIKIPFNENYFFITAGIQQVFLIVLMWSVLLATGNNYAEHSLRFGIFVAFAVQVCALVATFLNFQLDKQHEAKAFFQHPEPPKPEKPNDNQSS